MASSATELNSTSKGHKVLLGKYELGRLLGRGTFAKVYYARSMSDGSSVAIKVLDKSEIINTRMAPQIVREVSIMHRLAHPNIVKLHEVMATKSKIYLVMEYVKGGELFSKIVHHGRLSEPIARRHFQQLVFALHFCHANGVSHRDIKPENLLLDCAGNLKVSDFGLSALPEQMRGGLLHTACGTPAYTAPEVFRGKGYDGARADAWSCGVILFVLLAGFLPFNDANIMLMYRKICKREYEFPPWFSQSVRRVISRLLDPNPETRITIKALIDLPWFKKSLSSKPNHSSCFSPLKDRYLLSGKLDFAKKHAPATNAFDIISMSSGLDLSGLFEREKKREQRFISVASVEKILEKIEDISAKFGYILERRKGGVVGQGRKGSVLSVEVLDVASSFRLVDLKVEGGADGLGWEDLKAGIVNNDFAPRECRGSSHWI